MNVYNLSNDATFNDLERL